MQTGANKSFRFTTSNARYTELKEGGLLYERARNSDIQPYSIAHSGVQMLYVEKVRSFDKLPTDVQAQLSSEQTTLMARAAYIRGNCDWWRYTWPLHREYFDRPRILCPYRASRNRFALDENKDFWASTDTTVLYDNGQVEDIRYVLGLLNTRILTARFRFIGKLLGGGVFEYYENTVSKLPIPRSQPGLEAHDRVVALVRIIEGAASDLGSSLIENERKTAQQAIDDARAEIEDLAAELFGLTPDERQLLFDQLA
jgi:hypothetical protein